MKITRKTQSNYTATEQVWYNKELTNTGMIKNIGFVDVIIVDVHHGIFMHSFTMTVIDKIKFYSL